MFSIFPPFNPKSHSDNISGIKLLSPNYEWKNDKIKCSKYRNACQNIDTDFTLSDRIILVYLQIFLEQVQQKLATRLRLVLNYVMHNLLRLNYNCKIINSCNGIIR